MPQSIPRESLARARSAIPKHVTAVYLAALTLIALLASATYYLLDDVVSEQLDTARIVGLVGHQIMLAQRIGLLATDLEAGTATARAPLLAAISDMRNTEDAVAADGERHDGHRLSPASHTLFFAAEDPLDGAISTFIEVARRFADPNPHGSAQAYRRLESEVHDGLLPRLIAALANFERAAHQRITRLRAAQQTLLATLLIALILQAMFIFRPLVVQTRHDAVHLYRLATSDDLTGLANRRHFMEIAGRNFELARRSGWSIGAMVLDLDHFKEINDRRGHATGDAVLRRFGQIASTLLRQSDVIGRTGGDEFAILLPETDLEGTLTVAEKLRRLVAEDPSGNMPPVTACIGVAVLHADDSNVDELLHRADRALYQAKSEGRNRVASPPGETAFACGEIDASPCVPEVPQSTPRFEGGA